MPTKVIVEHVAYFTRWCVNYAFQCMWDRLKTPFEKIEQHFHDVAQIVQHNKHSDTSSAHFAQHFDQKKTTTVS